jgi:hypothetical protein
VSVSRVRIIQACDDPRLFNFPLWQKQRELLMAAERGPRLHVWSLGRRSGKTPAQPLFSESRHRHGFTMLGRANASITPNCQ